LVRRLGGHQSRSGRGVEEEKSQNCPCRELNPGHPAHNLVSILPGFLREEVTQILKKLHDDVFTVYTHHLLQLRLLIEYEYDGGTCATNGRNKRSV
jgi:hypothetical protein